MWRAEHLLGLGEPMPPSDQLIRELLQTRRPASPAEIDQIIAQMATAPFSAQIESAPPELRGRAYAGRMIQPRDELWFIHLAKRVLLEQQWTAGATAAEYLADLRSAINQPDARLLLYTRRGGHHAPVIARTDDVLSKERQGPRVLPYLLIVYAVERRAIITGYQFSELARVRIPGDALWLR